jgi:hypothetical protein
MSKIRDFFERIVDSKSPTSSRRFFAFVGLLLFSAAVICSIAGVPVDSEILYVTSGFILTLMGLTSLAK